MDASRESLEAELDCDLVWQDGSWSFVGCLAGVLNGWRDEGSWDCGGNCSLGLESTGVMFPMIDASAAVSISIEVVFEAAAGEDNSGTPEGTDGEGAGVGAPTSSAMDSSEESDIRSTVEGILDCLGGRQCACRYNNDLLALEAMRSI